MLIHGDKKAWLDRTVVFLFLGLLPVALGACGGTVTSDEESSLDESAEKCLGGSRAQYLGIGDSIAFGDNGFIPYTAQARPNDRPFVGYPDLVGRELFHGQYQNTGCPGETSASFLDASAPDNGCQALKKDAPRSLHVRYTGAQLDQALSMIAANKRLKAITLSISGNDLLLLQKACIAATPTDPAAITTCISTKLPDAVTRAGQNVGKIWAAIRAVGFQGELIYVAQYSTDYGNPLFVQAFSAMNSALATATTAVGGKVADVFTAFSKASEPFQGNACSAGLLIKNPEKNAQPACDMHPSRKGRELIADTVEALFR